MYRSRVFRTATASLTFGALPAVVAIKVATLACLRTDGIFGHSLGLLTVTKAVHLYFTLARRLAWQWYGRLAKGGPVNFQMFGAGSQLPLVISWTRACATFSLKRGI